jgi:hypothetical protein
MTEAISTNSIPPISSPLKRRRNESECWKYVDKNTRNCNVANCSTVFKAKTATTSIIAHLANTHQIEIIDKNVDEVEKAYKDVVGLCEEDDYHIVEIGQHKKFSHIKKHGPVKQKELDTLCVVRIFLFEYIL